MDNFPTKIISAIVHDEKNLEFIINKLEQTAVARHEISVQGPPGKMVGQFGIEYINPKTIQESENPPKKEPFLMDDFGWVVGLSFGIPIFLGAIIGIFILGAPHAEPKIFLYAALGALIGAAIGAIFVSLITKNRNNRISRQEQVGGFVLWITVSSDEKNNQIISILKKYNAQNIVIK